MKKLLTFCLFISICFFASAQKSQGKHLRFSSINQFGLLNGEAGSSYDVTSINGVAIGRWTSGVGVGIDGYVNRSIPVFAAIRREFGNRRNVPFVYADAGLNYTWLNQVQKEQKGLPYDTEPGLYAGGGVGVKMKTNSGFAVLMSAGYSYKQSKETVPQQFWWIRPPFPTEEGQQVDRLNSQFKRIVIRLAFQL